MPGEELRLVAVHTSFVSGRFLSSALSNFEWGGAGLSFAKRKPMARISRQFLIDLGSTNHCTFRSHNLIDLFGDPVVAGKFLELLAKYKERYGVLIHSYCLMGTHPHVLLTATKGQVAFSSFWKCVNQALARFYNKRNGRRGQVVMERLRSPMIQPDGRHLLTVMRYIDMNPVRANLVKSPKDWPYSSYQHYAFGDPNPLIDDAPDYLGLGSTFVQRREAYKHLFAEKLSDFLRKQPFFTLSPYIGQGVWMKERFQMAGLEPPPGIS